MQCIRQLVAGTDFSEAAERALEVALELAQPAAAAVTLVHVCELGVDDSDDQRLLHCDELLTRVVVTHRLRGASISGVLRCGRPWEKLDNMAAEVGASLIVIGRHGAGRGRSVEIGAVAERLVRTATHPVLTVAHASERFEIEALATNPYGKKNVP